MITFDVDVRPLIAAIKTQRIVLRKSRDEIVYKAGRLLVRELIKHTPPFDKGENFGSMSAAKKIGEKALTKDIYKVYQTTNKMAKMIEMKDRKMAARFRRLVQMGKLNIAEQVARESGITWRNAKVRQVLDGGQAHRESRHRGRVKRHVPEMVVSNDAEIKKHFNKMKEYIGFAKAGWLTAARFLHVKGVPGWITKHSRAQGHGGFQRKEEGGIDIVIENNVSYIDKIFNQDLANRSILSTSKIMHMDLEKQFQHNLRKLERVSR